MGSIANESLSLEDEAQKEEVFDGMAKTIDEANYVQFADGPIQPAGEMTVASSNDEPIVFDATKQAPELTEEEEEKEFFNNPENKKNTLVLANQIRDVVSKNWFSFNQFIRKTKEDRMAGYQKLKFCVMFGYAKTKYGDFSDGKENLRLPMWKIAIEKDDHVQALNDIINYHKGQIAQLEIQLKQYQ